MSFVCLFISFFSVISNPLPIFDVELCSRLLVHVYSFSLLALILLSLAPFFSHLSPASLTRRSQHFEINFMSHHRNAIFMTANTRQCAGELTSEKQ